MNQIIDLQWFSAEDEGRTEEPSEVKLQKARKEGRVAKSQELAGAFVMIITVAMLIVLGSWIMKEMKSVLCFYFTNFNDIDFDSKVLAESFYNFFLKIFLPFGIASAIGAIAGNIIQTRGFLFSTKPIQPKFNKILPNFGQYFKRTLFSFQGLFNVLKSILKVAVIVVVTYILIKSHIKEMLLMLQSRNIEGCVGKIASLGAQLLLICAVFFLVIAIPDYFVQKKEFMESMKMTKQEVKEEYKEMEGDPEVKGRLQQQQREILQKNLPRAVAEADVVITNPTHFAVALQYHSDLNEQAPQVTAKGQDLLAQRIKDVAHENDIPIVEDRPLARGLYTTTEVGDIIPNEYIRAIATVYANINYSIKK